MKIRFSFLISFFSVLSAVSYAQFDPNPELEWYTIETSHFLVHYHDGAEKTASVASKIAEEIYGPITSLYKYKPSDKTSLIINDESDYSNGATDYYGNRIEIAATALNFDLRGTHNWLRNVITHEFTHVIQVQSSLKFSYKVPSIYFQVLNYEGERRSDVLYGYPNVIISYPISGVVVPAWWAEGTSQYQRQQMGYDYWDSHRDMILRMRVLKGKLLSWEEMGQFASVTTYTAESIYNHGFAFVRYIASKYGENKLREISDKMGDLGAFSSESAFRKSTGKPGDELYREWSNFLKKDYNERVNGLKQFIVDGEVIAKTGFANYFPKFSPDGSKISYLSNKSSDYSSTSLFVHSIGKSKDDELLIPAVSGGYAWSPDGKKIILARRNKPNIHEKSVFDLYEYDIKNKTEEQITFGARAHSPSFSDDGSRICFVVNHDGTQNLCITKNPEGKKIEQVTQLTDFSDGEQIYSPKWSPDGENIIFDFSRKDLRSIARINVSTASLDFMFENENIDYRNPSFSPDGKYLYIASDISGIFNIYRYDLSGEQSVPPQRRESELKQVTNVLGGAFMPSSDGRGNLTYSSWNEAGYKIQLIKNITELDSVIRDKNAVYLRPERLIGKYASQNDSNSSASKNKFDWPKLKNFNDSTTSAPGSTKYTNSSTPLFLIPVLRFDNYIKTGKFLDIIKPGLYFYSQDVLGKMGIFGGASMNRRFERDLFLQFDYNNGVPFLKDFFLKQLSFVPRFTLAGYNLTRKTDADLVAGLDTIGVGITYDLLQFDFNMAFKIINYSHNMKLGFTVSKYSSKFETFVIPSANIQVPSTSTNYFNGRDLSLTYSYTDFKPSRNDDINPIGRHLRLKYDYEFSTLNPTLVVNEQGNVVEEFERAKFHRIEVEWFESFAVFNSHSLSFKLKGGSILGPKQDSFFDFYIAGFPGMKGYPFYSMGGNEYASANLTYRFPVAQGLNFKFLQFYFDKIYLSFYGDIGNAWNGSSTKFKDFKKDAGAEIRLQTYSYYVYPTSFAFNAAYGFDEFVSIFPSTSSVLQNVKYGKEWKFYFTVLFSFDFIEDITKRF